MKVRYDFASILGIALTLFLVGGSAGIAIYTLIAGVPQ